VVRLQQIATGGSSTPHRGGQPSVRGTEASTQGVIRAVYAQILGSPGYAGERSTVEEIKLENGDISLREFVRQVARSRAFQRRYWSGLYITKAIEVMHRRLLGRPTFGRWEIDAYFDTAARRGFYGVVDAMINSPEYNECFGEDTVPYERFITPTDRNARRVPALKRDLEPSAYADLRPAVRPDVAPPQQIRTVSDVVRRNLTPRPRVVGSWKAEVSGGDTMAPSLASGEGGPTSLRVPPEPTRRWSDARWQPGAGSPGLWKRSGGAAAAATIPASPGLWRATFGNGVSPSMAQQPGAAMVKALRPGSPQGFSRRQSLAKPVQLSSAPNEAQVREVVTATYRQLLNRLPFAAERLGDAESQLRDGQLSVAEFVAQIAGSGLFQDRLNRMAPLRAASAAYIALLGRAAQPGEVSRFLSVRASAGLQAALEQLLNSPEYARAFGQNTAPYLRGLLTSEGIPLATVNRTAALYGGNAGLTPPPKGSI
jgi:phycobilisome core-membrane linker protein